MAELTISEFVEHPVTVSVRPQRRLRSVTLKAGLILSGTLIALAVIGQLWTPYEAGKPSVGAPFEAPSAGHWFGTDAVGADILSKILAGGAIDISITLAGVGIAFVIGTLVGALAGYAGRHVDAVTMRITEIVQSFPALLLGMLLVSAVGGGIVNVIIVVAVLGIPGYLRLARAEILSLKTREFADASRLMGNSSWRTLVSHLVPNSMPPLIAFTAINASWVAIIVASLGFIGIGIEPGSAEWGSMIAAGRDQLDNWWVTFFPGVFILLLAMSFYLVGDGLAEERAR
jgi:peptide/nickel transport system permease protein